MIIGKDLVSPKERLNFNLKIKSLFWDMCLIIAFLFVIIIGGLYV
jgi:hypothetical protein